MTFVWQDREHQYKDDQDAEAECNKAAGTARHSLWCRESGLIPGYVDVDAEYLWRKARLVFVAPNTAFAHVEFFDEQIRCLGFRFIEKVPKVRGGQFDGKAHRHGVGGHCLG